jgi:hypothetical protein
MIKQLLPGIAAFFFFSCNNTPAPPVAPMQPDVTITMDTSFFPVTSFIKGQMRDFDSIDVTPLHIVTIQNRNDSQWMKRENLKSALLGFLTPEITATNLKKYFRETKLDDLTLNSLTLTYDPVGIIPDSIPLQNWNVYVNPKTGIVQRIFIVKNIKMKDQLLTQQLTWVSNTSAEIVNILNKPDGSSVLLNQEKFIWKF